MRLRDFCNQEVGEAERRGEAQDHSVQMQHDQRQDPGRSSEQKCPDPLAAPQIKQQHAQPRKDPEQRIQAILQQFRHDTASFLSQQDISERQQQCRICPLLPEQIQ